jgi:pyruvate kinase
LNALHFEHCLGAQRADIDAVLSELMAIRAQMVADAARSQSALAPINATYQDSARNLLHYLGLRRHDLRPLQLRLAALGLSSLGRAESHVLATVDAVLQVLHRLAQRAWQALPEEPAAVDFATGQRLLAEHTETLLGPQVPGRGVRIMVTMPSEAAHDYDLLRDLLRLGMNCMRINCAHDDAGTWLQMIEHLRQAERSTERHCRIVMDLGGPKLRTGPLEPGPSVARIRPRRDSFGRVTAPARVWLTADAAGSPPPLPADAWLPVPAAWLAHLRAGDRIRFTDARDAKRTLVVAETATGGCWAESSKTAYFVPGTVLQHTRDKDQDLHRDCRVGDLAASENALFLRRGDLLVLTRDLSPGHPATLDGEGRLVAPATIGVTIPEVFDDVRAGEPIWFDDGKIGAVIETIDPGKVRVRITHAHPEGAKLRADKGINLPESQLHLGALTAKDLEDLSFAARHADVIELSFPNSARDVEMLEQHLERLGERRPAIVLKIETRRGFEQLPSMLLTAMRWPSCGVMIARGDLAVECGFERLAEVQEEILWICEAAHVPVIWATQVLETLAKDGMPSRAEITDAAMGHRAECVMLNKGPHVLSAVRVLDDILRRMQAHQAKKRAMLRELRLAHGLPADPVLTAAQGPLPLPSTQEYWSGAPL